MEKHVPLVLRKLCPNPPCLALLSLCLCCRRWSWTPYDSIHHAIVCHSIVPLRVGVPLQIIFQDLVSVWIYLSIIQILHMPIHARVEAANTAQQFWTLLYFLNEPGLQHLFLYIGSKFEYTLLLNRSREDRVSESFVKILQYRIGKRHLRIYHGVSFARLESKLRLWAQMFVRSAWSMSHNNLQLLSLYTQTREVWGSA